MNAPAAGVELVGSIRRDPEVVAREARPSSVQGVPLGEQRRSPLWQQLVADGGAETVPHLGVHHPPVPAS